MSLSVLKLLRLIRVQTRRRGTRKGRRRPGRVSSPIACSYFGATTSTVLPSASLNLFRKGIATPTAQPRITNRAGRVGLALRICGPRLQKSRLDEQILVGDGLFQALELDMCIFARNCPESNRSRARARAYRLHEIANRPGHLRILGQHVDEFLQAIGPEVAGVWFRPAHREKRLSRWICVSFGPQIDRHQRIVAKCGHLRHSAGTRAAASDRPP